MYQVWFTSNELPPLTEENKITYRSMVENQMFPIGNIVGGRHLLRCMTEDFAIIATYLTSLGKEPVVCGARYQDGTWHDDYPCNQVEFDKYMQPIAGVDINGDSIIIQVVDNTSAGWTDFNYVMPVLELL